MYPAVSQKHVCAYADGLLARFVVQTREDLALLQQDAKGQFDLRITATNFAGNAQQVLTHPRGDASRFARCEKFPKMGSRPMIGIVCLAFLCSALTC